MTTVHVPADSLFGVHNLPYGVFSVGGSAPRVGTRLGDTVLDLAVLLGDEVFARPSLNAFMAQGYDRWVAVRREIAERVAAIARGKEIGMTDTTVSNFLALGIDAESEPTGFSHGSKPGSFSPRETSTTEAQ